MKKDNLKERSLDLHKKHHGKIAVQSKVSIQNIDDLSLAYSPGVAKPCEEIMRDKSLLYDYTSKGNMVAVITDGSAVLGLGNIGADASLPVMEGKAVLFKEFAGIDAFPICVNTQDEDEFVQIVKNITTTFGGINLEDIAAPKCISIEKRLKEALDIPVFHDDQHGTAIVVSAALINALKLSKKNIEDIKIVLSGTGAAGNSIARLLTDLGATKIVGFNKLGVVKKSNYNMQSFVEQTLLDDSILKDTNAENLEELFEETDVFIGVSAKNIVSKEMIRKMKEKPIIFALANPDPEIAYEDAIEAGAFIVGTGRSDYPNQINNVLAFPGIFKGALEAKAKNITEPMKLAAAKAIASIIHEKDLTSDYVVPSAFNKLVVKRVSNAVKECL